MLLLNRDRARPRLLSESSRAAAFAVAARRQGISIRRGRARAPGAPVTAARSLSASQKPSRLPAPFEAGGSRL